MRSMLRGVSGRPARLAVIAGVTLVISGTSVFAHRVIGRRDVRQTALVQSPTASPTDLPVQIFTTGLSVICFRVTNTSTIANRITAIGLELPGDRSGFALVSPLHSGVSVQERIGPVPEFPNVTLDFAVVAGGAPSALRPGLVPNAAPVTICVSGPFDPAVPIETLLNGVFVAFEGDAASGNAFDIGVWERR